MRLRLQAQSLLVKVGLPLCVFAGIVAAFFWPVLAHISGGLHDRSDTVLNTWIIGWQAHILHAAPLALFDAPIFYPLHHTLAFSEIMWPDAPLAVPLLAATQNPILVYNLLFLASFLLAGFGAYLLALYLTRSRPAALLAGLIYAFSPHQFGHLSQLQLLSIGWLPLIILFLDRFWSARRPRDGALLALVMAAQALSAFYYAFQVVLVAGLYVLYRALTTPWRAAVPRVAGLVGFGALAGAIVLPFAIPYFQVRADLGLQRSLAETLAYAPPLTDYLLPLPGHPVYGPVMSALAGPNVPEGGGLFLGLVPVGLAVLGLLAHLTDGAPPRHRQAARWDALSGCCPYFVAAVVLSLGPQLKLTPADPGSLLLPFGWLYEHVPGMTAIRAPGRFGVSAFLALGVLASLGLAKLLRCLKGHLWRGVAGAALAGLCLLDYAGGQPPFGVVSIPPLAPAPPLYAWLAEQAPAAIVELPLTSDMAAPPQGASGSGATQAWPDYNVLRYQYFGLAHWQPTVDGYSGFVSPHHRELGLTQAGFPDERSLALLRGLGVKWVIVHSALLEAYRPGQAGVLRAVLDTTSGIWHERDFGPDWVYRLEMQAMPSLKCRFWSDGAGSAWLILSSDGPGSAVLSPGLRLHISGAWRSAETSRMQSFEQEVGLPLVVSTSAVVPIAVPLPQGSGEYMLELHANNSPVTLADYSASQKLDRGKVEARELLPLRLASPGLMSRASPGETLLLPLVWQWLDRPAGDYGVSLRINDRYGNALAQNDQTLSTGRDPVRDWRPGLTITTTHQLVLPTGVTGRFNLRASVYRAGDPVAYLFFDASDAPQAALEVSLSVRPASTVRITMPPAAALARFRNDLYLLDVRSQPPTVSGDSFVVWLNWASGRSLDDDYTIFAHLVSPSGQMLAQKDQQPQEGRYPTSIWEPGELVSDTLQINVPASASGQMACLQLGLYDSGNMVRLPRTDAATDFWQPADCWSLP